MNYEQMSDCVEFRGYKNRDGYGRQTYKGKVRNAHRVSYCIANGVDIDDIDGYVIMHKCDNPACINPDHLEKGSQTDNIKDRDAKGRTARNIGNKNQAKLSDRDVEEIRNRYISRDKDNGGVALADEFGVTPAAISLIVNNKNWRK